MARLFNRYRENVPGTFYVDSQCIDCDLCRQTAPQVFKRTYGMGSSYSYVHRQPVSQRDLQLCVAAQDACPVGAIGSDGIAEMEDMELLVALEA